MADQAQNFASAMKHLWMNGTKMHPLPDGGVCLVPPRGGAEENAVRVAERLGASRVGPAAIDDYIKVPGDIPASLWRWADGSERIIFDNGSGTVGLRRRGRPQTRGRLAV